MVGSILQRSSPPSGRPNLVALPLTAEKILVTAAGLRGGPPLEHAGFPAIGYDVRARANGFDMDENKSPELIISGIKSGYTVRILK